MSNLSEQQFYFHGTGEDLDREITPQNHRSIYTYEGRDYFPPEMTDEDWGGLPEHVANIMKGSSYAAEDEAHAWMFAHERPGTPKVYKVAPRGPTHFDLAGPADPGRRWVKSSAGFDIVDRLDQPSQPDMPTDRYAVSQRGDLDRAGIGAGWPDQATLESMPDDEYESMVTAWPGRNAEFRGGR